MLNLGLPLRLFSIMGLAPITFARLADMRNRVWFVDEQGAPLFSKDMPMLPPIWCEPKPPDYLEWMDSADIPAEFRGETITYKLMQREKFTQGKGYQYSWFYQRMPQE